MANSSFFLSFFFPLPLRGSFQLTVDKEGFFKSMQGLRRIEKLGLQLFSLLLDDLMNLSLKLRYFFFFFFFFFFFSLLFTTPENQFDILEDGEDTKNHDDHHHHHHHDTLPDEDETDHPASISNPTSPLLTSTTPNNSAPSVKKEKKEAKKEAKKDHGPQGGIFFTKLFSKQKRGEKAKMMFDEDPVINLALQQLVCPLTKQVFKDPVTIADGYTYERDAIMSHLESSNVSPMTGEVLKSFAMVPNKAVAELLVRLGDLTNFGNVPQKEEGGEEGEKGEEGGEEEEKGREEDGEKGREEGEEGEKGEKEGKEGKEDGEEEEGDSKTTDSSTLASDVSNPSIIANNKNGEDNNNNNNNNNNDNNNENTANNERDMNSSNGTNGDEDNNSPTTTTNNNNNEGSTNPQW